MSNTTATLLGAIIGGIIGVAGTYLGSIYTFKKLAFLEAARGLRFAFHDELTTLRDPLDTTDPCTLLQQHFRKHWIAFQELRHAVPFWTVRSLDDAWRTYHCRQNTDIHGFEDYFGQAYGEAERKRRRELAVERIEHLLTFANARPP